MLLASIMVSACAINNVPYPIGPPPGSIPERPAELPPPVPINTPAPRETPPLTAEQQRALEEELRRAGDNVRRQSQGR